MTTNNSMIPPSEVRALAYRISNLEHELSSLKRSSRRTQLGYSSLQNSHINLYFGDEVRARIGQQSDGQAAVVYMGGSPPPQPEQPTLSARQLAFVVGWGGTFEGAAPKPSNFQRIDIHVSETLGFTPTGDTAWASLFDKGAIAIPGDVDEKFVKLVAVSNSQVPSEPSLESSITPLPADYIAAQSIGAEELAVDIAILGTIRSPNYVLGTSGWAVHTDGSIEAYDIEARGVIRSGTFQTNESPNPRCVITTYDNSISFYDPENRLTGYIEELYNPSPEVSSLSTHGPTDLNGVGAFSQWRINDSHMAFGNVDLGESNSSFIVSAETAFTVSNYPQLISDPSRGDNNFQGIYLRHRDANRDIISNADLHYTHLYPERRPTLRSSAANVGLVWSIPEQDLAVVSHSGAGYRPIRASAFNTASSKNVKQNIRDLSSSALSIILSAPSKQWEYRPEPGTKVRVPLDETDGPTPKNPKHHRSTEKSQGKERLIEHPTEIPVSHVGPKGEDLPQWLFPNNTTVDLRDLIGVLWKAVEEIADRLDVIEAQL